jgi:predicted RNA binding protein YcfA (HicA-like mRNA interferase family)
MPSCQMTEYRLDLERSGFSTTLTRGGHVRISHPLMNGPVFAASTPSDHRAIRNVRALIRRKMHGTPT